MPCRMFAAACRAIKDTVDAASESAKPVAAHRECLPVEQDGTRSARLGVMGSRARGTGGAGSLGPGAPLKVAFVRGGGGW